MRRPSDEGELRPWPVLFRGFVSSQQPPLIGDLEQELALPKVFGLEGKRLGFPGALEAFVYGHASTERSTDKKVPTGG
jgi:hypothetical protein